MSREMYRARNKKVQKLGRDGLVEQDKATGQEERISQRIADISFGPERSQEQAAGRAFPQRAPAQGKQRKQPRPAPPPELALPTDGDGAMESTWYHSGSQAESLQVHIDDRDSEGIFRIHYDYQVEKFSEAEIEQMHQRITSLLFDAVGNDGKKLCELEILPEAEKRTLLVDFNDTAVDYPRDKCIHQLFEEQVSRMPKQAALVFSGITYSYERLNSLANGLAWRLRVQGITRGDIVAILAKRGYELVVAILAILKAGAAYLPIDNSYPIDRIETIVADSKCKTILTYGANYVGSNVIALENNIVSCTKNPKNVNSISDICAVIYTSGSTGQPKGTLICHQSSAIPCGLCRKYSHR